MRLGGTVVVLALLASVLSTPATAAVPGYVATSRATCQGGNGVVELRQEQVAEGWTHVTITGTRVANGRWSGGYSPNTYAGAPNLRLDLEAADHTFQVELDVAADADEYPMLYLSAAGSRGHCIVGFDDDQPDRFYVAAGGGHLRARFPDAGAVAAWGRVGCPQGSRASWRIVAEFGSEVVERRARHVRCGRQGLKTGRVVLAAEGSEALPDAVRVAVHRADGTVRRIGYSVTPG